MTTKSVTMSKRAESTLPTIFNLSYESMEKSCAIAFVRIIGHVP